MKMQEIGLIAPAEAHLEVTKAVHVRSDIEPIRLCRLLNWMSQGAEQRRNIDLARQMSAADLRANPATVFKDTAGVDHVDDYHSGEGEDGHQPLVAVILTRARKSKRPK